MNGLYSYFEFSHMFSNCVLIGFKYEEYNLHFKWMECLWFFRLLSRDRASTFTVNFQALPLMKASIE